MKELLFPLGSLDELWVQLYTLEAETMQKELGRIKQENMGKYKLSKETGVHINLALYLDW